MADSSYTNPLSLRLEAVLTGMRYLPSRMATEASGSVIPDACACLRMAAARLEMAASFSRMPRRMLKSSSEAESLISP